jgi:hypothetical protein
MVLTKLSPPIDDFLDYLVEKATPEEVLAYKATEEEQEYANDLLERGSAGLLTPEEKAELDAMLEAHRFVTVVKAKALKALRKP